MHDSSAHLKNGLEASEELFSVAGVLNECVLNEGVDTGSQVTSIIWSKQYKELISSHGFPDNHLSVWFYPSLNKVIDLPSHDARGLPTALSTDGQTVASAASDDMWSCLLLSLNLTLFGFG